MFRIHSSLPLYLSLLIFLFSSSTMETPKTTYDLTDQLQDFEQYICPVSTQTLPVLYSHVLIPLYSCHMFIVLQ